MDFMCFPDNVPDGLSAVSNRDWATGTVKEHCMRIDAQLLVELTGAAQQMEQNH